MQIPNVDGNYKTRDGSVVVTVTRSIITVDVVKPKEKEYTVIDEDNERQRSGRTNISKKLRTVGDGLSGLTYALIGDGKH